VAVNPPARAIRSAAVSFMLSLAIALSSLLVLVSYERNGSLPDAPLGLGLAGPFEQSLGRRTFVGLAIALIVVCLFDVVVGVLLWTGRRAGGVLGLVMSVFAFPLAIGFAAHVLLVVSVLRVVLILAGWSSLGTSRRS
jgi:hypothetical protein